MASHANKSTIQLEMEKFIKEWIRKNLIVDIIPGMGQRFARNDVVLKFKGEPEPFRRVELPE